MDNQVILGGQINMQNNMRTIHVGIFHLFQKNKKTKEKKHAGYKNPDTAASHHWYSSPLGGAENINKQ